MDLVYTEVADPFGTGRFNASAPLITDALALFGNNSFLDIADPHNNLTAAQILTLMCEHGSIPFGLSLEILTTPDFMDDYFHSEMAFNIQRRR
jgi:hypothetical protein